MDLIKDEMDKEFSAIGFRSQRRNLKYKEHQIGKTNIAIDKKRKALMPGKKISKTGKVYYEYRKNRIDLKGINI
ncbi:MAG TPA: hypothetical protein VJ438_06035 [Candidatus Nanoarchaeia archaeon]|nr:hypothetical protein [Candidatus Nanoarchaeia archaeon]